MTEDIVISIGNEAILTMVYLAGPLLLAALAIGLVVSVLQAITQINESTLTFIPKMLAIIIVIAVMGPWMLKVMQQYTINIIQSSAEMVK